MSNFFNCPPFKAWAFALLIFTIQSSLSAQNSEIGLALGGAVYRGDIEVGVQNALPQMRLMGGVFYRHHLSHRWALRGQLTVGQFFADEKRYPAPSVDDWRPRRGISFSSPFVELAILPEWRFLHTQTIDFYAFTGLAGFYFKPKTDYNEPFSQAIIGSPNLDKNASFSNFSGAIPLGVGAQWFLGDKTAIGLEVSGRKTYTDHIDGLSLMAQPKVKDNYFFINLTLSMRVSGGDKGVSCPKF